MNFYHLHFSGLVQGVGFRPFVYKLAKEWGLNGWVINSSDGVHIHINASKEIAFLFHDFILQHPPQHAIIRNGSCEEILPEAFTSFEIRDSTNEVIPNLVITPDYALCDDCRRELKDPENRRFRYPFITCTHCGPRYSIIKELPYDRQQTTMSEFFQCPTCLKEYNNPLERRHFSQTNSCINCGIQLDAFEGVNSLVLSQEEILSHAVQLLKQGKIIAIKGIGGYLFCCDACNPEAVRLLRSRKNRPAKPFALLYPSFHLLEKDFELPEPAKQLLLSPVAPILLLHPKPVTRFQLAKQELAPGLQKLGVLLPYAPLLELIASDFAAPMVATSANLSGSPIVFENNVAEQELTIVADLIISHNRTIVLPQDDSVWNQSPLSYTVFPIRRSRGMAPSFLPFQTGSGQTILALGALLKSSFSLSIGENTYVSQYLGSTESFESQQTFRHSLKHFLNLFKPTIQCIATDAHPEYFSHQLALELGAEWKVPVMAYQHHKAHAAAVLAENKLLHQPHPILCIVWDGTGLGEKGELWGGEAFIYQSCTFERLTHLPFFPILAGDKMAREPRLSCISLLHELGIDYDWMKKHFSATEWQVYTKLLTQNNKLLKTDAAGRIFDAVASILQLKQQQSFEGEAAMLLEEAATQYLKSRKWLNELMNSHGPSLWTAAGLKTLLEELLLLQQENCIEMAAAVFHIRLASSICQLAEEKQVAHVAFSGGVFQNGLLCDLIRHQIQGRATTYFHRELPSNDENISLGQLVLADLDLQN